MSNYEKDGKGNRCYHEYFGGVENAKKALASLVSCTCCISCTCCKDCEDCKYCEDVAKLNTTGE